MSAAAPAWVSSTRPLAECGRLLSGGTPSKSRADYWDGSVPWFSSKEIRDFELRSTELGVTHLAVTDGATLVPAGTVLFVVRGMSLANEFRVGVTGVEATFNQDVKAVVPSPDVDARYLARCLRWREPDVLARTEESSHGTKRLPGHAYASVTIPLPPLAEQRRIAAILDAADALRAKRREALAEIDALGEAVFLDLFGNPLASGTRWPLVPFAELVSETQYGTSAKANDGGAGLPVLRMNNITPNGAIDLTSLKHVELARDHLDQYTLRPGDLLFNRTNSPDLVGKMGLWQRSEAYAFAGYLVRVRVRLDVAEPWFVKAWFNTPEMKMLLRTRAKPSINMSNISATELLKFPVVRPPLAFQRDFARRIAAVDALKAAHRASLAEMDALFASLQHRAFREEL